ncbi:unnamed protein product [Lymnaea stagnalis]|uniref:Protein with SprT-like domain at the N terminus n=1 Tax=Lymnaea stagnalis TaxID=6523 RepID=A0AAV2H6Q5_LYMST
MFGLHCLDDSQYARQLQEEYDREAAALLADDVNDDKTQNGNNGKLTNSPMKSKPNTSGLSPVDPSLEFLDPNPNILELFLQYNVQFFWGRLAGIEVKWSPRMTLCAGLCVYEGHGGLCSVRLSLPLLKLRPRKDLVETLLHEMIHAYLFITDNDRDHDGHGPQFQSHMHRINKSTGANISIYHSFHDEVEAYQQHWWKCDGPCQNRKPYFGYVKRAMNRAPSPRDFWWAEHQATCGGTYTKVKEPEGYGQKKGKGKEGKPKDSTSDIRVFVSKGKDDETGNGQRSKSKIVDIFSVGTGNKSDKVQAGNSGSGTSKSVVVNGVLMSKVSSAGSSSLFSTVPKSSTAGTRVVTPSTAGARVVSSSDSHRENHIPSKGLGISPSGQLPEPIPKHNINDRNIPGASKMMTDRPKSPLRHTTSTLVSSNIPNNGSTSQTSTLVSSNLPNNDSTSLSAGSWDDNEDDSWMLDAELDSTSHDSNKTNGSQDHEVIDLTSEAVETDIKMPNNTKLKSPGNESFKTLKGKYLAGKKLPHLKPKTNAIFTPGHSGKKKVGKPKPSFRGPRTKNLMTNGNTGAQKFPSNFVSVCVGNESWSPRKKVPKKKIAKNYIFDELDSDDGLWEEERNHLIESPGDGPGMSRGSCTEYDSLQVSATLQSPMSPKLNTVKKSEFPTNLGDTTRNKPGTSTHHEPPPVRSLKDDFKSCSSGDRNKKFTGQGHRLGTGEERATFLSQIRKTFTEKSTTASDKYSHNLTTGEPGLHLSTSSKKRSSEIAFGSQSPANTSKDKSLKITSDKDNNTKVKITPPTPSYPIGQTNDAPPVEGLVSCPVCSTQVQPGLINNHLDLCLLGS